MKKAIYLFLLFAYYAHGQVVRTEPAFPSQVDDITVYFDAKLGDGGLEGFTGDVYAHTGVITNQSTGPTDWKNVQGEWGVAFPKTKMTSEGNDIYSIAFNIEDFYGITDGVTVESLAFVFRSTDGGVTGRDEGGSDIYTPVFPPEIGLLMTINSPSSNGSIYNLDESVEIDFVLNDSAIVAITDNGTLLFDDRTKEAQFLIENPTPGFHELQFYASNEEDTILLTRNYIVIEDDGNLLDPPIDAPLGFSYSSDSTFLFQLYAPGKKHVFLLTSQNEFSADLNYKMNLSTDESTFWLIINKSDFESDKTMYQYLVDGGLRIPDPFSTVVLDPFNDQWVEDYVLAELPEYPDGLTDGIVTAFDYEAEAFTWTDTAYAIPEQSNLVIYETLMRDFLDDHNYQSLIDTLDYLEKLGVNAIELMPVTEFEGNQSWGYNTSFHMALDKYYGSRTQFKAFVNAAHERGISVIMDVVYNHVFSQSPLAQLYWDPTNFRPADNNPYLNVIPKHPFNVGYDVNHESEATKTWVKQTLAYWMEEFHIDGFRFDLSKGFTQLNSGENADLMAQYEPGRISILKDYADHVWSVNEDAYVILEHFAYNEEETELANYGMMLWGNMNHSFIDAVLENKSELEWLDYTVRGWDSPHAVGYMESHDEERLMVRLLDRGFSLERALERVETASSIFYLVPGPKMLWQFGELGFDYSINRCVSGDVSDNCRLDPKPVVWEYLQDEERAELNDVVSDLIHLKTAYPTFSTVDFTFNDANQYLKTIHFNHDEMDALVMANFRDREQNFIPKFQYAGTWYEYFTGDSLIVENTEDRVELLSGEYRIYTSERITPPNGFSTSVVEIDWISELNVFPNPVRIGENLQFKSSEEFSTIEVWDNLGRLLKVGDSAESLLIDDQFSPGIYFLRAHTDSGLLNGSFIVE